MSFEDAKGSYFEAHRRKQPGGMSAQASRLMTDRGAYMSFLEVQLERVSSACLTTQGFDERLHQLSALASSAEERIASLAKVAGSGVMPREQTP